jgi:hypothetical protein
LALSAELAAAMKPLFRPLLMVHWMDLMSASWLMTVTFARSRSRTSVFDPLSQAAIAFAELSVW